MPGRPLWQVAGKREADQEAEAQRWIETIVGEKFPAVLPEGFQRSRRCCLTIKTGTTIVGILNLVPDVMIFFSAVLLENRKYGKTYTDAEICYRLFMPFEILTPASRWIVGILAIIGIMIGLCLLHSNFKNISRLMEPALYWRFGWTLHNTARWALRIEYEVLRRKVLLDHPKMIPGIIIMLVISWTATLWIIQAFRVRIADIKKVESDFQKQGRH